MKRVLWVLMLAGSTVASAQSVTLQQLLEAADKNNLDRRVSVEQTHRAEAEFRQAWGGLLPSMSASASATYNQYPTVIEQPDGMGGTKQFVIVPSDQYDAVIRFDLPLLDPSRWARAAASSVGQESSAQRDLLTRDQIRRQVVSAWYNYAAALAVRESAKKSLVLSEAQAKLQEIRQNAGAATELERLRANAERAHNVQQLADTENLVAISRRSLRSLTFVDPGEQVPLPEDDLRAEAPLEELEARVEELPAVRASDKDVLFNERLLTAQRLAALPVIGAQFTERVTNATGFSGRTTGFNVGLNLSWRLDVPTFQAMSVQQSGLSVAQLQAERSRLNAKDQIHSDWQRQRASLIKIDAARAQVEAAQRAASVARDRYAVGVSTQVDVIQADRDLFSAEVSQIQARTDLASARTGLRISAGQPLAGP